MKEACGDAHLKVILETGELGTYDNVRRASLLAIAGGADFIKTSTGKVAPAATLPVTLCMLEVIRDVHDETGRVIGMKPAGGIRTAKQAIQYLCVAPRDARRRLADARPLPLRRLVAAQRRADADPQAADRRLPVPRRLHDRLMARREAARARSPAAARLGVRAGARVARDRLARGALRPLHRRRAGRAAVREWFTTDLAGDRGAARRGRAGRRRRTSTLAVDAARERVRGRLVARCARPSARSTSSGSRGSSRSARASSRSPSRSTAASRSRSRATSTSRSRRRTSSTTPGWADKLEYAFPNRRPRPARRRRADHPLELPAPDARVEDRAGARLRQHRRAQAGRDDAADRAALRRRLPAGGGCRPASSTSSPATARPGRTSSSTPGSTRSRSRARPRSGKAIQRELAGRGDRR